jgi:hypothetical protein
MPCAATRDRGILFTYDLFAGVESLPQPGPVYVHEEACPRCAGDSGFPKNRAAAFAHWKPMAAAGIFWGRNM